jgi:hypothetical protein
MVFGFCLFLWWSFVCSYDDLLFVFIQDDGFWLLFRCYNDRLFVFIQDDDHLIFSFSTWRHSKQRWRPRSRCSALMTSSTYSSRYLTFTWCTSLSSTSSESLCPIGPIWLALENRSKKWSVDNWTFNVEWSSNLRCLNQKKIEFCVLGLLRFPQSYSQKDQ